MKLYRISHPTKSSKFFKTIADIAKFLGYERRQSLFSLVYYNKVRGKEIKARDWTITEFEINDSDLEKFLKKYQ